MRRADVPYPGAAGCDGTSPQLRNDAKQQLPKTFNGGSNFLDFTCRNA